MIRRLSTSAAFPTGSKQDVQFKIIHRSLQYVPTDGWTRSSITKACKSLGYPSTMNGIISNGPLDMISYFQLWQLETLSQKYRDVDLNKDFYARLLDICQTRLEIVRPFATQLPSAVNAMTRNASVTLAFQMADNYAHELCRLAGDDSYNMRYYSRRASVSAICASTDLYMSQDG
eukprot:Partr_v1_DN27593_c0_g1_i3_m30189 putative ubiquinone biosynthesis protein Coq9